MINGLARLTRREAVGATAIAGAAIALLFGAAGIARANTYGYSDIYNCYFLTGIAVNYTPVRLVIENSGTWRHIYRVQFGTVTGHSNSEKINQVSVRENSPAADTPIGVWYTQNFGSVTGGVTYALSSGYTPWIGRGTDAYAHVVLTNQDGDCFKWIQF